MPVARIVEFIVPLVVSLGNSPVALLVFIGILCLAAIVAIVRTVVQTVPKLSAEQIRAWAVLVATVKGKGGTREGPGALHDRPDPPAVQQARPPGKSRKK